MKGKLKGKNLDSLEQFKNIFPNVDLKEGDEIEMEILDDVLLLKTHYHSGGGGKIRCRHFTAAICDVYFGQEAVSPTLKEAVLKGIPHL